MAEPAVGFDVKGEQIGSKDLNESEMLAIKGQLFGKIFFNRIGLFLDQKVLNSLSHSHIWIKNIQKVLLIAQVPNSYFGFLEH